MSSKKKLASEVVRHLSRLSRAAVDEVKEIAGVRDGGGDLAVQEAMAQKKDLRTILIDCMKMVHLDEGGDVEAKVREEVSEILNSHFGHLVAKGLLDRALDGLVARETTLYSERMRTIRKFLELRFNVILLRHWRSIAGESEAFPRELMVKAK